MTIDWFDEEPLIAEDTLYALDGDPIQKHRLDDPNVWGLSDVARGRTPAVPTTIYNTSGDSASGVAGLLMPDLTFYPQPGSNIGRDFTLNQDGETFTVGTTWDGAKKQPEFKRHPELVEQFGPVGQEHSRGLLLGDYQSKRAERDSVPEQLKRLGSTVGKRKNAA